MTRAAKPNPKAKQKPPHPFVIEALAPLDPEVRRVFSGFGVYVGDRIVLMLRDSPKSPRDNGVWLVLSDGVDPSDTKLRREFPSIRPIELLRSKIGHWLLIPADGPNFEAEALRACDLLLRHDARLGRVPKSRQQAIGSRGSLFILRKFRHKASCQSPCRVLQSVTL
jgi:hypothetical protein